MGFENYKPADEIPAEQQSEVEQEEGVDEETSISESPEEAPIETKEDLPSQEEKSTDELLEEYWPSREKIKEEKMGPSWGKAAIAAAALVGTLAAEAEAAGVMRPKNIANEMETTMLYENQGSPQEMEAKMSELYNRVIERFREKLQKNDDFSWIKDGYLRRGKEARAARERAWMQTVIDHPEKVSVAIDTEKGTVFFSGTYTDPDSGAEQPFEQVYQFIKK